MFEPQDLYTEFMSTTSVFCFALLLTPVLRPSPLILKLHILFLLLPRCLRPLPRLPC